MPAYKPYDPEKVGAIVDVNHRFLKNLWSGDKLWGNPGQERTLRDHLFDLADEQALRDALAQQGITVTPPPGVQQPVRVMLVDIENARTKTYGPAIRARDELFYVLVLPPNPQRTTHDPSKIDYKEMLAWSGAYYHASSDGYGM
jgi:hypothetical protein